MKESDPVSLSPRLRRNFLDGGSDRTWKVSNGDLRNPLYVEEVRVGAVAEGPLPTTDE